MRTSFESSIGKLDLPLFFPDATRAVVKTLDSLDIKDTKTPGILVNTFHLFANPGAKVIKSSGGVRKFMNWDGALITDSGGFQIMSLIKSGVIKGEIIDKGIIYDVTKKRKKVFTPEDSIRFQFVLDSDLFVVLDDFTPPNISKRQAKVTVDRTINWAKRCKSEFERLCVKYERKPYLIGVVQGGDHPDLRAECAEKLIEIGFDGLGYGGWPITNEGKFDIETAKYISKVAPQDYFLYGLGIGKPHEIVECHKLGYQIFDCVLPTRDARHKRLYVYNADSIDKIDISKQDFYSYYVPDKMQNSSDPGPVSLACDCLLCKNYSRAYLAHLFRIKDLTALRLSSIHNLRFYSLLMEKLRT